MTTTVSGSQITFNDNTTQNTSAYGGGFAFRNRIINGDMRIDQRNAGASVTPTASSYTLDRWRAGLSVTSKFSVQQSSTAPAGFNNSLLVTSLSAYTVGSSEQFQIAQRVEGYNIADLGWGTANAQTVTLSFWVRSSLTGTFGGAINNGGTRNYPYSYTISSANTWEQKTITVVGDTSGTWATTNGTGLIVFFGLGVGATLSGTAGAWSSTEYVSSTGATNILGTNGATFYITGVQLEKGSTATSFDYRPYGQELALCQRYYQIGYTRISQYTAVVMNMVGWCSFNTQMRATPTLTNSFTTSGGITASGTTGLSVNGFAPYATTNSTGAEKNLDGNWTATAEL